MKLFRNIFNYILQLKKIKSYKIKLFAYYGGWVLLITILVFSVNFFVLPLFGVNTYTSLKKENKLLQEKLELVMSNYKSLNAELDSLLIVNNDLRLAVNLNPLSDEEKLVGIGGGHFDNTLDFLPQNSAVQLKEIYALMDEVERKVELEKNQYLEISAKLKENKKLFESMPAIKPCEGTIAAHGFGFRVHPILNIKRMHDGIDIVTDRGTPVYATGKGTIDFVGRRGGLGLIVEIDHGFGYITIYAHLSKTNVKRGQKVSRGDLIANTGNSGLSSGPHLHYEVHHNGVKQNPLEFFFDNVDFFGADLEN